MYPLLPGFLGATVEHRGTKVRSNDLCIVAQVTRKSEGKVGCATTDIEETRARQYPADNHGLLAPVVVQAKAQHGIEDIIMPGNRGKHLPHRIAHSLPPVLTSDIMRVEKSPNIMGPHRSRAQLSEGLGRISWLCRPVRKITFQSA
jgi:hypothetical protein